MKGLTSREQEVIEAMAECDLKLTAVGKKLYMHRLTVLNCCGRIFDKTGLNPQKFYDLEKLLRRNESVFK